MKSFKALLSSLLLASGLLVSLAASAENIVVVNSLTGASPGSVTTSSSDAISNTDWVAQQFTTPADHFIITDVALQLWNVGGVATGTYDVSFWDTSGTSGAPGVKVANVAVAAAISALGTTNAGQVTFNALSIGLTEATNYFLVVSSSAISGTDNLSWGDTTSQTFTGHSTVGFNTTTASISGPGTWVVSGTSDAQQMKIQAEIPEPASLALFAIGLAGMRFSRRKAD